MQNNSDYVLEFTIKGLPKMSNQLLRGHWASKQGHARKWKKAVDDVLKDRIKPPCPLISAVLTLTRHSSSRPDFDGLVSSFKAVVDGLVESGVLADDSHEVIGVPTYIWEKASPGKGFISVRVEGKA